MKNVFALFVLLLSNLLLAQEYKFTGVKDYFIMGLLRGPNHTFGVMYRDKDKTTAINVLDSNLAFQSKVIIDLKMGANDEVIQSNTNGKSSVLQIFDVVASDYSKQYLVSLSSDFKILRKLTPKETIEFGGKKIIPDPSGQGYYFTNGIKITKYDNSLNQLWEYNAPKGENFIYNMNIKGNINEVITDEESLSFASFSSEKVDKKSMTNTYIVSVDAKTGTERFRTKIFTGTGYFSYDCNFEKKGTDYYFSRMHYDGLGTPSYNVVGAELAIVDKAGKLVKTLELKESAEFSNFFYADKKISGYFLRFVVGKNNYFIITETPKKENKFVIWELDNSFNLKRSFAFDKKDNNCLLFNVFPSEDTNKPIRFLYNNLDKAATTKTNVIEEVSINMETKTLSTPKVLFKYSQNRGLVDYSNGWSNIGTSNAYSFGVKSAELDKFYYFQYNASMQIVLGYSNVSDNNFYVKKLSYK